MDVNKHICFRVETAPQLAQYLRENGLGEEIIDQIGDMFYLDILTSNLHWPIVSQYVEANDLFCMSETLFTEQERQQAEWLEMRSPWRFDYPQPERSFLKSEVTYSAKNCCNKCGSGLIQIEDFRMKKTPKWGKRCFCQVNWVEDELFTNDIGKECLKTICPDSVLFRNVKDKRGQENWPDFHQIVIPFVLEKGLIGESISIRSYEKCPCCGITKYLTSGIGMLQYKRDIFASAPDMVKTAEIFGSGHVATRQIIVSQSVYRKLTEKGLTRSLAFSPIELVD